MDFVDIFPFAPEVGYLSLILVNFIGSLVPFVPLPGFLLLATMSVGDKFDLHILALSSAIAATVAKQIIFFISYEGRRIIKQDTRDRMRPFERLVKKYGAAAAFFAAATPIPDDLVYIPLGLAKYNPKRFLIATLAGKLVLSYVIVFASHYLGLSLIEPYIEDIDSPTPIYVGIAIFGASMTAVVVLMLRLDWRRILGRFAPWTLDSDVSITDNVNLDTVKDIDGKEDKPSDVDNIADDENQNNSKNNNAKNNNNNNNNDDHDGDKNNNVDKNNDKK